MQRPLEARQPWGRRQLMALLRRVMIRASKADLVTLPPCHRQVRGDGGAGGRVFGMLCFCSDGWWGTEWERLRSRVTPTQPNPRGTFPTANRPGDAPQLWP